MCVGALLYAGGLLLMRYAATPLVARYGAGVADRFGLSGCRSISCVGLHKILPAERPAGACAGTAAGRSGNVLFAPFGVAMIDNFRLAVGADGVRGADAFGSFRCRSRSRRRLRRQPTVPAANQQSFKTAAGGGVRPPLLCGCWCSVSSPAASSWPSSPCICGLSGRPRHSGADRRLGDRGDRPVHIIGSLSVGWLQNRMPKRYILSTIYSPGRGRDRSLHLVSITAVSAIAFGADQRPDLALHGAPDLGLGRTDFARAGCRPAVRLCLRQPPGGGFLGVWLGGIVFEPSVLYADLVALDPFGVLSALINLPIVEKAGRTSRCASP